MSDPFLYAKSDADVRSVGVWSGYAYLPIECPSQTVWTLNLQPTGAGDGGFKAEGDTPEKGKYTLSGHCRESADGVIHIECRVEWTFGPSDYINGHIDTSGSLVGCNSPKRDSTSASPVRSLRSV